ncbi:MAG: M28 family metallopeptidase [Promethearchaeota archaeon]
MEIEISEEISDYMYNFIKQICTEIGPRCPCSEEEKKGANYILKEMEHFTDKAELEEFYCAPRAFLGWIRVSILLTIIAMVFYFLTPLNPILFALIAFIISILPIIVLWYEFFCYKEFIDPLFKKRNSFNTIGTIKSKAELKNILIFSGHHDSAYQFNLLRWLKFGYYIVIVIGMYCIIRFSIHTGIRFFAIILQGDLDNTVQSTQKLLWWAIPSMFLLFFFEGTKKNGGKVPGAIDNLSSIAVILGLGKYLKEHRDIIPENTEIRLISFGCEEAGLRGAFRYVERHLEELKQYNTENFNIEMIALPEKFYVFRREDTTRTVHSKEVVQKMVKAANSVGIDCKIKAMPFLGGGTDSTAFSKSKIKSACLLAMSMSGMWRYYHQSLDNYNKVNKKALENALKIAIAYILLSK